MASAADTTSPARPSSWSSFRNTVVRFQPEKINLWLSVRNTTGVVVAILTGVFAGGVGPGLTAGMGALNVAFSDADDPYVHRARRMLSASALVCVAVCFGALSGHHSILAVLA